MTNSFDVKYLAINKLAYSINKYTHLNPSDDLPQVVVDTATQSLELMKRYEVIHPITEKLLQYLSNQWISTEDYNSEWISTTRSLNESFLLELEHDMKQVLEQAMEALSPESSAELFGKIRRAIIITIVEGKYEEGIVLLNNYLSVVDFSTQPKNRKSLLTIGT